MFSSYIPQSLLDTSEELFEKIPLIKTLCEESGAGFCVISSLGSGPKTLHYR
jgi:hypothetical protein